MLHKVAKTDWLGIRTIFYNTRTKLISDNINDLIDPNHIVIHAEGLRNYLEYGYCVFGQTPVEEIKILQPNCEIKIQDNELVIRQNTDPFDYTMGKRTNSQDVLDMISEKVLKWEKSSNQDIILPLTGGFDSRLLASFLDNKKLIDAYTFGASARQEEFTDVVYAEKLSEILGINWKQVYLEDYMRYMDEWYEIFGISTHVHGQHQMDFFYKIRAIREKENRVNGRVLSGIYGDLWAGNFCFDGVDKPDKLIELGITHGMCVNPCVCKLKEEHDLRNTFYEKNKDKLKERDWCTVYAARTKIILLSYLLRIPEYMGYTTWSPFVDFEVVSNMINLDWNVKERRKWQVEYFRKKGLLIGELGLKHSCDVDIHAMEFRKRPMIELDVKLLGEYIDETYLTELNKKIKVVETNTTKYVYEYWVFYALQKLLRKKEYGE